MNQLFAINKPKGPTSHDIINRLRKITGEKTIGHAGTLDPLASGVLVVGIGRQSTRKLGQIVKSEKEYLATITLGTFSTTDDEEGIQKISNTQFLISNEKDRKEKSQYPKMAELKNVLKNFIGEIEQTPPQYSAIKISGTPAYKFARAGKRVEIKSRIVEVKSIVIDHYQYPIIKLRVICGSGVYIRTLARDIGMKLGCGAYLSDLIRTRVGEYTLENAYSTEEFAKSWQTKKAANVDEQDFSPTINL